VRLAELVDLVLPATCVFCRKLGPQICVSCKPEWMHVRAVPLELQLPGLGGVSLTAFDTSAAALLTAIKDHGQTSLLAPVGEAMGRVVVERYADSSSISLLPVPSSRASVRRRGVNLGTMLATRVSRESGLPVDRGLTLVRKTADQRALGAEQRFANLQGSMSFEPQGERRLVIIDDVSTTGATILEAFRAVSEAGSTAIGFVTFAHTKKEIQQFAKLDAES
jgi:predicted amidophosphoribosyltransferase